MIDREKIKAIVKQNEEEYKLGLALIDILEEKECIELFKLAQIYLSVSSKMPEKKTCSGCGLIKSLKELEGYVSCCPDGKYHEQVHNQAVDDCTLSAMKMIEEKDKRIAELEKQLDNENTRASELEELNVERIIDELLNFERIPKSISAIRYLSHLL